MLGIVNYGVGNLRSVENMARKAGASARLVSTPGEIAACDRLILPGVGHFGHVMKAFDASGLREAVTAHAIEKRSPLLGICVGAQMMGSGSEEAPGVAGLGWLPMCCRRFPTLPGLRIPHMAWNTVSLRRDTPIVSGVDPDRRYYFVHSFYMDAADPEIVIGETTHGIAFASIVGRDNIYGTQFHLEKSHRFGLALMQAFAALPPVVAAA